MGKSSAWWESSETRLRERHLAPQTQDEENSLLQNRERKFQGKSALPRRRAFGTKTITLKKRARILKILRGEEQLCAENSKFRFWVRNKGFRINPPEGYVVKPADAIVGRNTLADEKDDLYVPGGNKDIGSEYKKVAIVENFFDIIFGVHVEIDGRNGKHAGQKRTYRTITETYAFLPREAVTKFLLNCSECQKRPNSPAVRKVPKPPRPTWKLIESLFPTPLTESKMSKPNETDVSETTGSSNCEVSFVSKQSSPENLCNRDGANKTANREPPPKPPRAQIENYVHTSTPIHADSRENVRPEDSVPELVPGDDGKLDTSTESEKSRENESKALVPGRPLDGSTGSDTSDSSFENIKSKRKFFRKPFEIGKFRKGIFERNRITETCNNENLFPICYPLPKYDGRKKVVVDTKSAVNDTDAFAHRTNIFREEVSSAAEPENAEEEAPYSGTKEAEKLKMMLLAWSGGRNGDRLPEDVPDEASQIWAGYHNALSLSKQTPPIRSSPTQETGSVHDETSSSGNKDDDDDEEEEPEEKIDPLKYDPERLKAFNMFVRLFVDENLDRIVPISKQPKEKIQAIIDSCTRQFPEFSERARKRIRTYLKSCRRNKRTREGNSAWEPVRQQSRPTPAHLTSVQAEQILAQACENESHNAKRMRLGLEPVTQPMPGMTTDTSTTVRSQSNNEGTRERDHYTSPVSSTNSVDKHSAKHEPNSGSVSPTVQNKSCSLEALAMASANSLSPSLLNGSAPPSSVAAAVAAAAAAPTAMYRPNFSQAFQRATAGGTYTTPGLFSLPCSLTNGTRPTDLSMKNKPLLTHKLNPAEMTAVRQLITGYRESAAFLLRSADELEQLLRNQ